MSFDTGLGSDRSYLTPDDYQVCFQSDTPFLDRHEDVVDDPRSAPRLRDRLPGRSSRAPGAQPCVQGRNADGSFVYLTFLAPAGDPKGRV